MVAGAVGVQEWYFKVYFWFVDGRNMLMRKNSKKCVSFWRKMQILLLRRVYFLLQIYGSFGDWWHKVRARGARGRIILI